jgi:hypothetical protein
VDRRKLEKLGGKIYAMSIRALKRTVVYDGAILGFDAEYHHKTKKLLSFQLHYGGKKCGGKNCSKKGCGLFVPCSRMSPEILARHSVKLLGTVPDRILLVSYFSLAELQFLPVSHGALGVREYARGSLDVNFLVQQYNGMELEIFDLARWYDFSSLAKAAESIGEKKLEFERGKMTWAILNTRRGREYAVHDAFLSDACCEDLRGEFAKKGIDIISARTPANASSQVFRLHYGPAGDEKWYCDKNRARLAACLGTWGGRAEVYSRGKLKGKFHEHDIKGAYPDAAFRIGRFPVQGSWHKCKTAACSIRDVGSFVHLRFRFPAGTLYPCLPVPTPEGSIIYPGLGESWATGYEARLAREMGARLDLLEGWGYRKGVDALSVYMRDCIEARKTAKGAARVMWKLLANSLIGKFAQRTDRISAAKLWELSEKLGVLIEDLCDMSFPEIRMLAEAEGIKVEQFSLGPVWMPEWNGLITGYTRARLGRALWKKGGVYCHTDSLWTRDRVALPGWEIKRSGAVTIARTRFAAMWSKGDDHIAHHSVWTRLVAGQMLKKFDGKVDVVRKYPKSRPLHFKEAVKRGDTVGRWIEDGDPSFWRRADTRWDGKRELLEDGTTHPWETLEKYLAWKETQE